MEHIPPGICFDVHLVTILALNGGEQRDLWTTAQKMGHSQPLLLWGICPAMTFIEREAVCVYGEQLKRWACVLPWRLLNVRQYVYTENSSKDGPMSCHDFYRTWGSMYIRRTAQKMGLCPAMTFIEREAICVYREQLKRWACVLPWLL